MAKSRVRGGVYRRKRRQLQFQHQSTANNAYWCCIIGAPPENENGLQAVGNKANTHTSISLLPEHTLTKHTHALIHIHMREYVYTDKPQWRVWVNRKANGAELVGELSRVESSWPRLVDWMSLILYTPRLPFALVHKIRLTIHKKNHQKHTTSLASVVNHLRNNRVTSTKTNVSPNNEISRTANRSLWCIGQITQQSRSQLKLTKLKICQMSTGAKSIELIFITDWTFNKADRMKCFDSLN